MSIKKKIQFKEKTKKCVHFSVLVGPLKQTDGGKCILQMQNKCGDFVQIINLLQGHPFMESMRENRALLYSLMGTGTFIFLLACGVIPEISEQFGIVDFPPEVFK